jgi:curved DNA-binding protein CbpA
MDPRHLSIYKKIIAIHNHATRLQMIDTVLGDPAFVQSTKSAGIYANILQVAAAIRHGHTPPLLPGEGHPTMSLQQTAAPPQPQHVAQRGHNASVQLHDTVLARQATPSRTPQQEVQRPKRSEKALNFFSACLRVLNIEEEVALTEEALTKAYKKAVIKAHPDKPGGSEEAFDAVTRAYAYLMDILKLVQGRQTRGGAGTNGTADAAVPRLETVHQQRAAASQEWQMPTEPVKLNPKNLNMTAFNQLFEQTRIPDPDEDGYGDWLKNQDNNRGGSSKKFSGEFNRDVFNRMFEQEAARDERQEQLIQYNHPQELMLAPTAGVELGRDRPNDYTAAPNASLKFTDLRAAYTRENTVSNQIQGVRVENRDFNQYKAQRERAPDMYNQQELASLQQMEAQTRAREDARRIRAAQEQLQARDYHERMKQLVIRE